MRLWASMSDYHPESRGPSVGGNAACRSQSSRHEVRGCRIFETCPHQGVNGSLPNRMPSTCATASTASSLRSESSTGGGEGGAQEAEEEVHESVCRFASRARGAYFAVHVQGSERVGSLGMPAEMARKRRSSADAPWHQTNIDQVCNNRLEPFTGIGQAPSRHDNRVVHRRRSRGPRGGGQSTRVDPRVEQENLEIIVHFEVKDRVMPWTKAVFLILSSGRGGTMAASMSMPSDKPPADIVELSTRQRQQWAALASRNSSTFRIRHFDGVPLALCSIEEGAQLPFLFY